MSYTCPLQKRFKSFQIMLLLFNVNYIRTQQIFDIESVYLFRFWLYISLKYFIFSFIPNCFNDI